MDDLLAVDPQVPLDDLLHEGCRFLLVEAA